MSHMKTATGSEYFFSGASFFRMVAFFTFSSDDVCRMKRLLPLRTNAYCD
jgi:hypothetical protein